MMRKLAVVCALFLLGSGCAEPEDLGEPAKPATSVASGVAEHPPRLVFYKAHGEVVEPDELGRVPLARQPAGGVALKPALWVHGRHAGTAMLTAMMFDETGTFVAHGTHGVDLREQGEWSGPAEGRALEFGIVGGCHAGRSFFASGSHRLEVTLALPAGDVPALPVMVTPSCEVSANPELCRTECGL